MAKGQIQNVVEHQHLPIAIRPGADADGGRLDLGRNHGRDFARDAFEQMQATPAAIERHGVAHELLDAAEVFALHLVAAHHVDRLRRQANVARPPGFRRR